MPKISQKNLIIKVYKNIIAERLIGEGDTVIVALSGGPDSVCLFDILAILRSKLKNNLKACHFNHKLRGAASERDKKFVQKLCQKYGVELIEADWNNKPKNKKASEEEARNARYEFFEKILKTERGEAKIALAHNSNDLAETLVQRLIRGTGLKGLRSIPSQRENFIRPLLKFSRTDILEYLKLKNIKYRTDKSNFNLDFLRNKIRHRILPQLKKINPNVIEALGSTSRAIEDDYDFLESVTEDKLRQIIEKRGNSEIVLNYKKWATLSPSLSRLTLRLSVEYLGGGEDINYSHIENVRTLLYKKEGRKSLPLPHHLQVSLERGKIIVLKTKN
jgi:tRNA(Ile)-lysidine synthase